MSDVLSASNLNELNSILDNNSRVVVDFQAPSWCVPCRKLAPHFKAAAEKSPAVFVEVDIDVALDIRDKYDVMSVPQVYLFENGQKTREIVSRTTLPLIKEIGE